MAKQTIYRFSGKLFDYKGDAKSKEAKALLGGKGAGLVMMAQQGCNVPPGFTIPCTTWAEFHKAADKDAFIDEIMKEVEPAMDWLRDQFGFMPLVSVRSGAPVSCPGMMDTILNVGLTADSWMQWADRIGQRPALDSNRRLIQMLGSTGYGVDMGVFDFQLAGVKKEVGAKSDTDLSTAALQEVCVRYLKAFEKAKGFAFPANDAKEQLRVAIAAVFDSWMNPRAIEYRKLNKIDENMGTAVNVQAMVFGNMGEDSGTGVLFSRDPSTGAPGMMGEYLVNAQGEDVVAGIRTPSSVKTMIDASAKSQWFEIYLQLQALCANLETAYKDMVDIEFTVQKGELFVLQSRTGKREAQAAFRIATDLVAEGVIDVDTALKRLTKEQFTTVRRKTIDPKFKKPHHLKGIAACSGVASGKPVFTAQEAVSCSEPCILVRHETDPDDIAGMAKAAGILTQTGGATSHAAVVARAMDKPCVVGATEMKLTEDGFAAKKVTIDGATGRVWFDVEVPVIDASSDPAVRTVMDWCLQKLDAVEACPVGLVGGQHRVFAAYWWGSAEVADAVLAGLDAGTATLDVRSPRQLAQSSDIDLLDCFGVTQGNDFQKAVAALVKAQPHLKGLALVAGLDQVKPAVPAEYAAYCMLSQ